MSLLKQADCDLGQANNESETPAHVAAYKGCEACLCVLKEFGCDLGRADNDVTRVRRFQIYSVDLNL